MTPEIMLLSAGQAVGLASVDLYCVSQTGTTAVYWLDCIAELALVIAWGIVWRQGKQRQP